jgi:polygalacturonase
MCELAGLPKLEDALMFSICSNSKRSGQLLATLAFTLAIVALSGLVAAQPAHAADVVRSAGDYGSLQSAIDAAQSGDSVYIPAGTWAAATVSGKQGITIYGDGVSSVISSSGPDVLRISSSSSITLKDFAVRGDYSVTTQRGIGIFGLSTGLIRNIDIANVGFSGIFSNGIATNIEVTGSNINNCGDFGIQFKAGASGLNIHDNRLSGFASRLYPGHCRRAQAATRSRASRSLREVTLSSRTILSKTR